MVVDEAHIPGKTYQDAEVLTLPILEFREKYGGIPFKQILRYGPASTSVSDTGNNHRLQTLKNGVVRCIPFSDTAPFVDAAVVFDERNQPVMELGYVAVRGLGAFYVASEPSNDQKGSNIARIYGHLQDNPLPATVNQGPSLYQRVRSLFTEIVARRRRNN